MVDPEYDDYVNGLENLSFAACMKLYLLVEDNNISSGKDHLSDAPPSAGVIEVLYEPRVTTLLYRSLGQLRFTHTLLPCRRILGNVL